MLWSYNSTLEHAARAFAAEAVVKGRVVYAWCTKRIHLHLKLGFAVMEKLASPSV